MRQYEWRSTFLLVFLDEVVHVAKYTNNLCLSCKQSRAEEKKCTASVFPRETSEGKHLRLSAHEFEKYSFRVCFSCRAVAPSASSPPAHRWFYSSPLPLLATQ